MRAERAGQCLATKHNKTAASKRHPATTPFAGEIASYNRGRQLLRTSLSSFRFCRTGRLDWKSGTWCSFSAKADYKPKMLFFPLIQVWAERFSRNNQSERRQYLFGRDRYQQRSSAGTAGSAISNCEKWWNQRSCLLYFSASSLAFARINCRWAKLRAH